MILKIGSAENNSLEYRAEEFEGFQALLEAQQEELAPPQKRPQKHHQ